MRERAAQLIAIMVTAVALFAAPSAEAGMRTPADRFARSASYYLRAGTDITPAVETELAKFDLIVLPAEAQVYNKASFARLRQSNPNIVILAYVPSKSYNFGWVDPLHATLAAGIEDSWWLRDPSGNRISIWGNTAVLSGISPWNDYLPRFVRDEIWSTGLWDGVFYDEFSSNASWMNGGNIDIHRDGVKDDPRLLDTAWERGMLHLLDNTRAYLGADAVIVTNGDSTGSLQPYVNGRMFETFPTPWEAGGTWQGVMANYLGLHRQVGYTPVFIINGNTGNTGNNADYRKVRYVMASTLMGDGFFSFDFGEQDHGQLWRYDEMDVRLGRPVGEAVNLLSPTDRRVVAGVWRRDFENGVAVVNATGETKNVDLGQELEKIRGGQDPSVNDGTVVTSVTLQPNDGLLLLKRIERIVGAAFPNGAFVRLFSATGERVRNGFFSYDPSVRGAAPVAVQDLDGDGRQERVSAVGGEITIVGADGKLLNAFRPYGPDYKGSVEIAMGDLDGDGKDEIVTGAGPGGGPHVRIFNRNGRLIHPGFFAYDPAFRGGVHVAVADLYGTGRAVIVTGAGNGGGPHVRIFNRYGRLVHPGFFAYDTKFRGGVNIAAGDLDGDGMAEIVTGAGPGGGPHVKVFNRYGRPVGTGFFAGDPKGKNGIAVAVTDADGDGIGEIATMTTEVFQFAAIRD